MIKLAQPPAKPSAKTPASDLEWVWKPIAAILVPLAVASIPVTTAWLVSDRGVDRVIVDKAFGLLETEPSATGGPDLRDWAIRVIERYSKEIFSQQARQDLQNGPLAISQTATNANPGSVQEVEAAIAAAKLVNNAKLLEIAVKEFGVAEANDEVGNPRIAEYNLSTGKELPEDVHWNSQFMNWVVGQAGYAGTNDALSRSWESWGKGSEAETGETVVPGCIAVMWRTSPDQWGGIVGLYLGPAASGGMRILGGNLFNRVDVATFPDERLLTCRLPEDWQGPAQ